MTDDKEYIGVQRSKLKGFNHAARNYGETGVLEDVTDEAFVSPAVTGPGCRLVTAPLGRFRRSHPLYARVDVYPNGTKFILARPGDWGYPEEGDTDG